MGAKSVRTYVAGLLAPVTGLKISEAARPLTPEPSKAVAIVAVTQVGPLPLDAAGQLPVGSLLGYTLTIDIAVAKTVPGSADDALDDLLDAVLTELDGAPDVIWSLATRVLYRPIEDGEGFPAYRIDVTRSE